MGQEFYIISIDKSQYAYCGKLTEIDHEDASFLPYVLVKPKAGGQHHESQPSPITALPDELLLRIYEYSDPRSILCLSLTCRRLWGSGWPYVQSTIFGRWRGTRVICEGDENDHAYLPSDVLSHSESELFSAGLSSADLQETELEEHPPGPCTLASWMQIHGEEAETFFFGVPDVWDLFSAHTCRLPRDEREQAMYLLGGDLWGLQRYRAFCNQSWTLRNLTKKAFVRGQRLNAAFHPDNPSAGLDLPLPGFGEAIVSQVTWSSSSTSSLGWNEGNWAGHRLEILTDEDHALATDETWTDETEEVIQTLAKGLELEVHTEESKKRKRELSF